MSTWLEENNYNLHYAPLGGLMVAAHITNGACITCETAPSAVPLMQRGYGEAAFDNTSRTRAASASYHP